MEFKWELLTKDEENRTYTYRAKVFNGWIYRHDIASGTSIASSLVFVAGY